MNRSTAWALIGAAFVLMIVWLVLFRVYNPVALFWYTILLFVVVLIVFVYIRRISKRQTGVAE